MPNSLDDHQASHTLHKTVPAEDYNRIRLALGRLKNPLRFPLDKMRCLEMILNDDFWLCIDTCMDDRPVLAWTEFQVSHREALHEPVLCELRLYHMHAGMVMGEVLENIGVELQQQLDAL